MDNFHLFNPDGLLHSYQQAGPSQVEALENENGGMQYF